MVTQVQIQSPETGPTDPNAAPQDAPKGAPQAEQKAPDPAQLPSDGDTPQGDAPAKLAGKFETPADLEKAYLELQKKLGEAPKAPEQKSEDGPKIPDVADVDAAKQAVTNAGLDFESLNKEWAEKGTLADESYAKLEKSGIPKAMVDAFIEGQKAVQAAKISEIQSAVHAEVGGPDKYGEMIQWAAQGLDAGQKAAFNKAIDSGDVASIKLAVQGLHAAYTKAGAAEPTNVKAGGKGGSSTYASIAEVMKDMGDARYNTDPAFRSAVEAKVSRSNVL